MCTVCCKRIQSHAKHIQCHICNYEYHIKCLTLSPDYGAELQEIVQNWYCHLCISGIFPFNHIESDANFQSAINEFPLDQSMSYLSDKLFTPFELNEDNHVINTCDSDHDLHYFNAYSQHSMKCDYYLSRPLMLK